MTEIINPKITLLQHKLALLMGREHCPVFDAMQPGLDPHALDRPWSKSMDKPWIYVVFNNKTFEMYQVPSIGEAYHHTFRRDAIPSGESIMLYLDDQLFRDQQQAETMDWSSLKRTEEIMTRSIKSKWYFWLTGWVDMINGGPGKMSKDGRREARKERRDADGDQDGVQAA